MYKVKIIDVESGELLIIMNDKDANEMGINRHDRVRISTNKKFLAAIVQISKTMLKEGEIGVYKNVAHELGLKDGDMVQVAATEKPKSIEFIKKKMDGHELTKDEIRAIVKDITEHNLSDIEMSAYVSAMYMREMNMRETADLTMAMVESGEIIEFDRKPVFDFHSVGGCPGNKVTLIIVPIVAAAGLMIPKTSSRAISSACGTADIFEGIANVILSGADIKRISEQIGGVIAWGGGVNIAPADDIIIRAEYPLRIDPYAQLIASVMAKKKAVSAEYLLLDIPMGPNTKVPTEELARKYARDFIDLGQKLGIKVECAITYGGQPVGRAVGPALEAREAFVALEGGEAPNSVLEKSCALAGILLEMGGVAQIGQGKQMARDILKSGKALAKMRQIVEAQGGNPNISSKDIKVGEYTHEIVSTVEGYVDNINNKDLVRIARALGAPKDWGAGLVLNKKKGRLVAKGEVLFTLYSNNKKKLEDAVLLAHKLQPITLEGMVIEHIPSYHAMPITTTTTNVVKRL